MRSGASPSAAADMLERDDAIVLCCDHAVAVHVNAFTVRARARGLSESDIAGVLGDVLTRGLTDDAIDTAIVSASGSRLRRACSLAALVSRVQRSARRTPPSS